MVIGKQFRVLPSFSGVKFDPNKKTFHCHAVMRSRVCSSVIDCE
jgi:hypothetical protein